MVSGLITRFCLKKLYQGGFQCVGHISQHTGINHGDLYILKHQKGQNLLDVYTVHQQIGGKAVLQGMGVAHLVLRGRRYALLQCQVAQVTPYIGLVHKQNPALSFCLFQVSKKTLRPVDVCTICV